MHRLLQLAVWSALTTLAIVSSADALAPKTVLGASDHFSLTRVTGSSAEARGTHQQSSLRYGEDASDSSLASRAGAEVASSAAQGARLARQLASREIAGGHSFTKHVVQRGEFPGIRTRAQFAEMIEGVMENASHVRQLSSGRTAFWKDGVVVIRNPAAVDGGTAFAPTNGFKYFLGLR